MTQLSSGSIKISGLSGETNFQEMIDKLQKIEMTQALKLSSWKSDWQLRLDAFQNVREAMVTYSAALKKMNSTSTFMVKNVQTSNSGVCTVKATGEADNTSHTLQVKQKASNSYASLVLNVDSKLASINTTGAVQKLEFNLGSQVVEVTVPPRCTLEGLKNIINNELGSSSSALGMRASIIDVGNGSQMLQLYSTKTGEDTDISIVAGSDSFWRTGQMDIMDGDWLVTTGQNAMVRIDGWPNGNDNDPASWLALTTNTLTHIPGLTINITGVGTTVIDISLDTTAIRENIQKFVDATNELRTLLKELTDYNATAQTISSDYAESQFETQKGGVLTGNYGMQLMMSKMKTFMFSQPSGFGYLVKDDFGQVVSGDIFSSLSQIGIKTDDQQGSPTYGLLVFENNIRVSTGTNDVDLITLDQALEMHAQGIAELFAADGIGMVDGYNFGYAANQLGSSFTKAGTYEVSYEVDDQGKIYNAYINGFPATWDAQTNQLTASSDIRNPARGLTLDIYNTSETTAATGPHTGTVRIKEGFLPGLIKMLDNDFLDPDSGDDDPQKGTLSILISQYQKIIANINEKIAREDTRLILWRQRMDLRFARLEATLATYEGLKSQLDSQVKTLSGNSGK